MEVIENKMLFQLARLSRMELSGSDGSALAPRMAAILEAFEVVGSIPVRAGKEKADLCAREQLRADRVVPSLDRYKVLSGAPAVYREQFRVPAVLG